MKKIIISGLIFLASGGFVFAQAPSFLTPQDQAAWVANNPQASAPSTNSGQVRDLRSLINFIISYINDGIYLLIAVATIAFVYNVIMYFVVKTEGDRKEAAQYLMYSIIGLAVILSFWGLVSLVTNTFSLSNSKPNIQNLYFTK